CTGAGPGDHVSIRIRERHHGVVEGCLDVGFPSGNILTISSPYAAGTALCCTLSFRHGYLFLHTKTQLIGCHLVRSSTGNTHLHHPGLRQLGSASAYCPLWSAASASIGASALATEWQATAMSQST